MVGKSLILGRYITPTVIEILVGNPALKPRYLGRYLGRKMVGSMCALPWGESVRCGAIYATARLIASMIMTISAILPLHALRL